MSGEFWQIVGIVGVLLSAWGGIIIATTRWTVNRGLAAQDARIAKLESDIQQGKDDNQRREREILQLRCDLPIEYVRREDSIRQETVMTAKMDALAAKIDALRAEQLREKRNDFKQ
jgi:hypothetical protein